LDRAQSGADLTAVVPSWCQAREKEAEIQGP
jgi:hypothetical protein